MATKEIVTAVSLHLIMPLIGLIIYLLLLKRMRKEKIINPPTAEYFFIFVNYGGLLLISLTIIFWVWSGLASIGSFYLLTGAPFTMVITVIRNSKSRQITKYHKWAYKLGRLYFIITPLTFLAHIAIE